LGIILRYDGAKRVWCRPCGKVPKKRKKERTLVKRLLYLVTAALVAMLILVPTAMAQEMTVMQEETMMMEKDLPRAVVCRSGRYSCRPPLCSSAEAS
jgi:hypothetical protein